MNFFSSNFVGHFCPPGSGSGSRSRDPVNSDPIRNPACQAHPHPVARGSSPLPSTSGQWLTSYPPLPGSHPHPSAWGSYLSPVHSVADPGCLSRTQIFPSLIPDPRSKRCRIRIKEFKHFLPKKVFLSFRNSDPGCLFRTRILIFYPSRIQGSKKVLEPDPQHCLYNVQQVSDTSVARSCHANSWPAQLPCKAGRCLTLVTSCPVPTRDQWVWQNFIISMWGIKFWNGNENTEVTCTTFFEISMKRQNTTLTMILKQL